MSLELQPISIQEARRFVTVHHRHHPAPVSGLFAVAVGDGDTVCGVAIVGRPVARRASDGWTAEVTRVCTLGDRNAPSLLYGNAPSLLYGACWRAARALGYRRLITYTLITEPGTSLRAAGWKEIGVTDGGSWTRRDRPRVDRHPLGQKRIWEAVA